MARPARGFTLIELMIVVAIVGVLAAIAIPNFIAMQFRAKEGSTKSNMHSFQVSAEDYAVQFEGAYPPSADQIAAQLPPGLVFTNPFDRSTGDGGAWETRGSLSGDPSAKPGITSYADSGIVYNIKGQGKAGPFPLVLTAGQ